MLNSPQKKKGFPGKMQKNSQKEPSTDFFGSLSVSIPIGVAFSEFTSRGKRTMTASEREEFTRKRAQGKYIEKKRDERDAKLRKARLMSEIFMDSFQRFYGNKQKMSAGKRFQTNKSFVSVFVKAVELSEIAEVSMEDYVQALFWWYGRNQSRPPRYNEVAGNGGLRIVKWYLDAKGRGEFVEGAVHVATGGVINTEETTLEDLFAYEEKMLKRMVKRWGSEAKVWEMFGDPNDMVFSLEFCQTKEEWKKLYSVKIDVEEEVLEHSWELLAPAFGKGSYLEKIQCSRCGVKARRDKRDGMILLEEEYLEHDAEKCSGGTA